MQEFINSIKEFINFGITPGVRVLLVGILAIFTLLVFRRVIKILGDSKVKFFPKFFTILLLVLLIFLTVFVATC